MICACWLLLAVFMGGCGAQPPAPVRQQQVIDGLTITMEWSAAPVLNQAETLLVTLADAQGAPVDGADVYLDLDMPAMPMGVNRPEAIPKGQGIYQVITAYTMTGEWQVMVVATVDGKERRATFTTNVVESGS